MTGREIAILGPLLKRVRMANPMLWHDLKYQTQYGPEFAAFPYYPAALELQPSADASIAMLKRKDKQTLVEEWRAIPRLIQLESDQDILRQYGTLLLDYIIETAKVAGLRTDFDK